MKQIVKVVVLMISMMSCFMQIVTQAKYIFSYENEIGEVIIDKIKPTIQGVEEGGIYKEDVTVCYCDNTEVKHAVYYYNSEEPNFSGEGKEFKSGTRFSEEGYYQVVVTDIYDNTSRIENFLIDQTPPEVKGIENGVIYDLPPDIQYYDKYGIEKIEITLPEELDITHAVRSSNRNALSDRTGHTIRVSISCKPQNVESYQWYIKPATENEYTLVESNLETTYTFSNLSPNTTYHIYCMAVTKENKAYMSNPIVAETLKVEQIEITEITSHGYTIKVSGIPDEYTSIYFPTWTDKNDQDDVIWYEEPVKNRTCTFVLDYSNHGKETGIYRTHIYAKEKENRVILQTAKIWLRAEEPEPEKVVPAGKTEIVVTDKAGNVTQKEYYTDKVVTISTATVGTYPYQKLKEILQGKILEYNDASCELKIKQSELDKITKLEITDYTDPNGSTFIGLAYFRNLTYLDIRGGTAFNINELETLDKLTYLNISNCQSQQEYDLSFVSKLQQLEYLDTTGTYTIHEEAILTLPNLKEWKK